MSQIGVAYRIMYLGQRGRTGLTNVRAYVFRPDQIVVGYYPLIEAPAPFQGCYFYDYLSSTDDPEGEYFSKVISPTEGRMDIVRFSLYKDNDGGASAASRYPSQLVGFVVNDDIVGEVDLSEALPVGEIPNDDLTAVLSPEAVATMIVEDSNVEGYADTESLDLTLERE